MTRFLRRYLWIVGMVMLTTLMIQGAMQSHPAHSLSYRPVTDPVTLVQQGRDRYQAGQYGQAIAPLQQAAEIYTHRQAPLNQALALSYLALSYQKGGDRTQAETTIQASVALLPSDSHREGEYQAQAQVFNTLGELQFAWGQLEDALESWAIAASAYESLDDAAGVIGAQINQIQALRGLGYYRRARQKSEDVADQLAQRPNSLLTLTAWRSLGNTQSAIGNHDQAKLALDNSLAIAQSLQSPQDVAAAYLSLGNLERTLGDRQLNQQLLASLQPLAQQPSCPTRAAVRVDSKTLSHYQQAADYYQQANSQTASLATQVRSQLNHLSLTTTLRQQPATSDLTLNTVNLDTLFTQLSQLPPSRFAVYARVRFALALNCLSSDAAASPTTSSGANFKADIEQNSDPTRLLQTAIQMARNLNDIRAESYAWGHLGQVYESHAQAVWPRAYQDGVNNANVAVKNEQNSIFTEGPEAAITQAKASTRRAMTLAQQIQAADLSYQWQWQMGRLLRLEHQGNEAIAYYTAAFDNLQRLRSDLVVLDTDIQFSFREGIEPLYRQLADLLLRSAQVATATGHTTSPQTQANLKQARNVLEALQLAELDNFFQDACSTVTAESLDRIIDEQPRPSAVLYSILLPDRLDLVLKVPNRTSTLSQAAQAQLDPSDQTTTSNLRYYSTPVSAEEVRQTVLDFRRQLLRPYTVSRVNDPAQLLYQWLIQPVEADLRDQGIEHIVFVLDGVLRNVSVSALYNGNHYLVDDYSVSLAPGLQILESERSPQHTTQILSAGLSDGVNGFEPLPGVEQELNAIAAIAPNVTQLLNQSFTKTSMAKALQARDVSIVHLATHGQFSSQSDNTFILTYDGSISINELQELLDRDNQAQAIELLVLSACQTASGDERAVLGLAGMAVRAGSRSTLASLWPVDDQATALLISEFYRYWYQSDQDHPDQLISKSKALQLAQQSVKNTVIDGDRPFLHPRYWSAFVLLGTWS